MKIKNSTALKTAAIAAIVAAISNFLGIIYAIYLIIQYSIQDVFQTNKFLLISTTIAGIIMNLLIFYGYFIIANKNKLDELKNVAIIFIIVLTLSTIFSISIHFNLGTYLSKYIGIIRFILHHIASGIAFILLGLKLKALKKRFGVIAGILSVLNIVEGAVRLSIIFIIFAPLICTIASVFEALLFFRAAKRYK